MSKQPSERAFDVASTWQGHKFDCAIHRDPGRDDTDCTCIVRDLAQAIDSVISNAREEAYKKAAFECERIWKESPNERPHYRQSAIADGCIESAAAIRALAAQEDKKKS